MSINPMQSAHGAPRCRAKSKRTKQPVFRVAACSSNILKLVELRDTSTNAMARVQAIKTRSTLYHSRCYEPDYLVRLASPPTEQSALTVVLESDGPALNITQERKRSSESSEDRRRVCVCGG
jgi:hypothetical protein